MCDGMCDERGHARARAHTSGGVWIDRLADWSVAQAKTELISRCCELDLCQCMKPVSVWPGQGPPADYVVNLGAVTRSGGANPQLQRWMDEARGSGVHACEFAKLVQLKHALSKRGLRLLDRFDSLFMRLYASRAVIPSHRDEGGRRLRIVGNSGRTRRVSFVLQAISDLEIRQLAMTRRGWPAA